MIDRLSPDDAQRVLRRAAELEQPARRTGDALVAAGHMTRRDITQIADEVGLAPDAVQRALAELDAGILSQPAPTTSWLDKVIGPADVVCTRSVAGPLPTVRAYVERYLRGRLMQVKRNLGERGLIWEPAADLWSKIRRALDVGQHLGLPRDAELETAVVPDPADPERVLVRLVLRLGEPRRHRAVRAAGGTVAGVALAALGVVAFHAASLDVLSVVAGAGTAAGSVAAARSGHHHEIARAETALLRFLDSLEHERGPEA
jgi:hypothetical protein